MKKYSQITALQDALSIFRQQGKTIGFVPTMGALHSGHTSLVQLSKKACDITVASIFVNPTQFNEKDDFMRYPRTLDKDIAMLQKAGCDIVFTPSEQEMYPEKDTRVFSFGALDKVMEGAFRPGHFNGVAQIVSRLFECVQPDKAFFGQKDFQQVAIIKSMVRQLQLKVEIVAAPIIREPDGLAMSSRNMLLSEAQRQSAVGISRALLSAQKNAALRIPITTLKEETIRSIETDPALKVEYFEVVDADSLQAVHAWEDSKAIVGCVAVRVGKIRLIDNIQLV